MGPTARASARNKIHVVRYADDFIVTGISKEVLENQVRPAVVQFLATRGLELSEEKTRITHISEGFDFLSQNVILRQAVDQAGPKEHQGAHG